MFDDEIIETLTEHQYLIIANKPIADNDINEVEFWDGNYQWTNSFEKCAKFKDFESWEEMMESMTYRGLEPFPVISETSVEQIPDGRWAVMVHYRDLLFSSDSE